MSLANAGYGIDKKGKTFETLGRVITFEFKLYMGILFICSCISWILGPSVYVHIKTFFNFSYRVTIYPVDALHFT